MTLAELIAACRTRADDTRDPPLWSDEEWVLYLSEAEREACVRARLIVDDDEFEIETEPGVRRYALSPSVIDVVSIRVGDDEISGWDLDATHLVLTNAPRTSDTLRLTVQRLPLADLMADSGPEIGVQHHYRLIDWALRCAYLKQDAETFDAEKAARYERMFAESFGLRQDANVLRKHRRKSPRVTRPIAF